MNISVVLATYLFIIHLQTSREISGEVMILVLILKILILGGGSGEHPGLVIHNIESVVAKYLYFQLSDEEENSLTEEEEGYVTDLYYANTDEILEFCSWSIRQYSDLLNMAKSDLLSCPLDDDEDVEDWLIRSIGELVYYSLPDLNPEHEKLAKIFSRFKMNIMQNVVCTPPGFPKIGGRILKDGEIKWGVHRWVCKP